MKNLLFRISPDIKIINQLLNIFGISNINDNHSFTRKNLIDLKTVDKINNIKDELERYYIPCKSKKYLNNLDEKKCITILRQFLKSYNHTLISKEKYIRSEKMLFYQVIPQQIDILTKERSSETVIISFE